MSAPKSESPVVLSAFTEEDSALLKSLLSQTKDSSVAGISENPIRASIAPWQNGNTSPFQIAAFLGTFDPLRLMPNAQEGDLQRLLVDSTVSTDGKSSRWTMRAGARTRVLSEAASDPEGLAQGVKDARRYLERSGEPADNLTQALLAIAGGKPPRGDDFAAMSKEELAANRAVLSWIQSIDEHFGFDAKHLLADIELAELLEPFRFLTGFNPKTKNDMFVGRADELRRLRTFINVLDSDGALESLHRAATQLFMTGGRHRILLFSGVGGVGKSTLMAKFILQHVNMRGDVPLRFAYLDFDRSTISAVQPITLLLEMIRQLGWQLPDLRTAFEELRNRIRQEMEGTRSGSEEDGHASGARGRSSGREKVELFESTEQELPPELIGSSLMYTYLFETGEILRRERDRVSPVLLVLDTFEEAQALGDQAVSRVEAFLDGARAHASLRVVVSGRDEVAGFFSSAERLVISEFSDVASRVAFLMRRGLTAKSATSVARQVGGRPLTLLLAARLVKEQGLASVSVSLTDRFRGLFNKYLIDGILYERILNHIDDDDVRTAAHPGLVLRRIDAEVLRQVVAPVVGLGEISTERATRILAAFRLQKDLVRVEPDGSVTHRPDVREQMLVLMSTEKPELTRTLHFRAASYYAARKTATGTANTQERDRIEEIYHLLSVGDSLERMPQLWFSKARISLARSVDEITNVAGRGTLKVLLGRIPTNEEASVLPADVLREYATRSIGAAMAAEEPEKAMLIFEKYHQLLPEDVRRFIEPMAFDRSGQWARAHELFIRLVVELTNELPHRTRRSIEHAIIKTSRSKSRGIEAEETIIPLPDALAVADFYERYPISEPLQSNMIARLILDLRNLLAEGEERRVWALPLMVVVLRLRIRLGFNSKSRVTLKEAELGDQIPSITFSGSPNASTQWLVTLTDEIDHRGLELVESMPVSDTVRGQLVYLTSLLKHWVANPDLAAAGVKVCHSLSQDSVLGIKSSRGWSPRSPEVTILPLILRHIMRPSTPQWYIPIACLLRGELGPTVYTSDIYPISQPELPFKISATLRTTKSLADFLGKLDQLGVLHFCLRKILAERGRKSGSSLGEIVQYYLQWRSVMLFDVDEWFASLEPEWK